MTGYSTKSTNEIRNLAGKGANVMIGRSIWNQAKKEFGKVDDEIIKKEMVKEFLSFYEKNLVIESKLIKASKEKPIKILNVLSEFYFKQQNYNKAFKIFKKRLGTSHVYTTDTLQDMIQVKKFWQEKILGKLVTNELQANIDRFRDLVEKNYKKELSN